MSIYVNYLLTVATQAADLLNVIEYSNKCRSTADYRTDQGSRSVSGQTML